MKQSSILFKRRLAMLLALIMCLSLMPLSTFAEKMSVQESPTVSENLLSGTCGKDVKWKIDSSNTLSLFGSGDIESYSDASPAPWFQNRREIENVYISDGITGIDATAFLGCILLKNIDVSAGNVSYVGIDGVLFTKDGSVLVKYPAGLEAESYEIPAGTVKIADYAFDDNTYLKNVVIPAGVTEIGVSAFEGCSSLVSAALPDGIKSIGSFAFRYCGALLEMTVPAGIDSIGSNVFYKCYSLSGLSLPDGIDDVGEDLFTSRKSSQQGLVSGIYDDPGPTILSGNCGNNLTYTLTSSVYSNTLIISGTGDMTDWESSLQTPWNAYANRINEIQLSNGITGIGAYAFSDFGNLSSIILSNSITRIGESAFSDCSNLTGISIPNGVTTINYRTFYNCKRLSSLTIGNNVTSLDDYSFTNCSSLSTINLSGAANMTSIGAYAFANCSALTTIDLPENITDIGYNAFLSTGYYDDTSNWSDSALYIGKYLVNAYATMSTRELFIKNNTVAIADYVLSNVSLGEGLIGVYGDYSVLSLKSASLPDSLSSVGKKDDTDTGYSDGSPITTAFGSAYGSTYYNLTLKSISLPKSLISIGTGSFNDCLGLEEFKISTESSDFSVIDGVLFNKDGSTLIKYPAGKLNLKYTVPISVTKIADYAFYYCSSLKDITIPRNVTVIGDSAFKSCTNLTIHGYMNTAAQAFTVSHTDIGFVKLDCDNHSFGSSTVITAPTCTTDGTASHSCINCGFAEIISLTKTAHISGDWKIDTAATCTAAGLKTKKCTACNIVLESESVPMTGHNLGSWSVKTPATCTAEGTEARKCTNTGCTYEETRPTIMILHTPGEFIIDKYPTESENGQKVSKCTGCGKVLETQPIPKLSEWQNSFNDIKEGDWYYEAIRFINTLGMVNGISADTFLPDAKMTRGMLVTLLGRLSGVSDDDYPSEKPFNDIETNAWFAPYVAWAKNTGVVGGYPDGTFAPDKTITREEMAKMFANYAKICDGIDITSGIDEVKYASYTDVLSVAAWARAEMLWATSIGLINGAPVDGGYALNPASTATRAEVAQLVYNYCKTIK